MTKTPTPRRVYVVHHAGTGTTRLVRAVNVATAVRHVVRTDYTAEVASQDDLIDLLSAGAKVEDAGADDGGPPAKVMRFAATVAEPPPERDPRVPDMFDDVPLPAVQTVISREPDPETVDAAHEAERRALDAGAVVDAEFDDPEGDPPACEPSDWSQPPGWGNDGSVAAMAARAETEKRVKEAAEQPGEPAGCLDAAPTVVGPAGVCSAVADAPTQAEAAGKSADHVEGILAMAPPQHAPIAAVLEGLASGEPMPSVPSTPAVCDPVQIGETGKPSGLPAEFLDYIEGDGPAHVEHAPPSSKIMALLGDAYRLGLNDEGLPGQIVGERAHVLKRGLYITDADAVQAEFVRGVGDRMKRDADQTVLSVLDSRARNGASGQAGEDIEHIRAAAGFIAADATGQQPGGELKRQAEAATARAGGKVVARYRDPATGQTWSGRGLKPCWLMQALEAGRTQDEFLIDPNGVNA